MDRMSRSDHKKKKELEEARKAGTLPPEKDVDGNLINPHIPEFMSKAPWYLNQEGPGLKHQKAFRPEHTQVGNGPRFSPCPVAPLLSVRRLLTRWPRGVTCRCWTR